MSPARCSFGRHEWIELQTHLDDDANQPIEGMMQVCRHCGAQKPLWGLLRKGSKLFNDKGQWLATVEKAAVK